MVKSNSNSGIGINYLKKNGIEIGIDILRIGIEVVLGVGVRSRHSE